MSGAGPASCVNNIMQNATREKRKQSPEANQSVIL